MLCYKLTSVVTRNATRISQKIAHTQARSLRLYSGSQISEKAFLFLRLPFVSGGSDHHAVFVAREH